ETSLTECLHMIHDLSSVHPDLARDTDWLASRLSGGNAPPLGVEKDLMSTYNVLLVATHEATPYRRLIKEQTYKVAYLVEKYPMLNKFTENYQAWRQAIADYEDISLADAKVELIRIFYGGKPTREIPFLLKVCDEVLIFDGCYVSSHGLSDDMDVEEACDECSKKLEVSMVIKRCSKKTCRVHHHYNYRKVEGQKYHSLDLDQMEYIFVNSKVGFSRQFLDYHNALQFRGGLSHNAIMFAQGEIIWEDRDQHARWHIEYANAQLYYQNEFLDFYRNWWHRKQFSLADWRAVKEVVLDGHEKVSAKCQGPPPAHMGRPRKNGANKQRHNGWFMAMDPRSGMVMSVADMEEPENNVVAKNVLRKVVTKAVNLNYVIYDKMCVCLKSFATDKDFKLVKYWSIDRFHTKAHSVSCPCSPIHVRRLDLRLRSVNSSIAEQTFSWFRGYACSFNTKAHDTHIFYVLLYVKMHTSLVRQNRLQHLNAFSARAKIAKAARVLRKPASKKYHYR
ncbi:unnamed protein product, partial [Symbiodinium microadriaticum]